MNELIERLKDLIFQLEEVSPKVTPSGSSQISYDTDDFELAITLLSEVLQSSEEEKARLEYKLNALNEYLNM